LCEYTSKRVDFENIRKTNTKTNAISTNAQEDSTAGLLVENFSSLSEDIIDDK
jgi:hypothetical protein